RALEYVEAGVVLLDETGRVRYWNPGAARILDVAEQDALLRRAEEASPALGRVEQALRDADGHALTPVDLFGGERWLAATQPGFPEGRVLVLRDATAEQRLEHARSDFLATASHELRTPLSAVYGAVRTLRRTDRPYDPALSRRLLTMIEEESNRLNEIVEQI